MTRCLAELASTTLATTEVLLDVSRAGLRGGESNAGNLVADSLLHAYDRAVSSLDLPERGPDNPVVAIMNSGGIPPERRRYAPHEWQRPRRDLPRQHA